MGLLSQEMTCSWGFYHRRWHVHGAPITGDDMFMGHLSQEMTCSWGTYHRWWHVHGAPLTGDDIFMGHLSQEMTYAWGLSQEMTYSWGFYHRWHIHGAPITADDIFMWLLSQEKMTQIHRAPIIGEAICSWGFYDRENGRFICFYDRRRWHAHGASITADDTFMGFLSQEKMTCSLGMQHVH